MPLVATKAPYTLFIVEDDITDNPREESDNFGRMVCFHSRYNLGDKHNFNEPRDFLIDLLNDRYSDNPKPVLDYIKAGNAKEARLEYNRSEREWVLKENNYWSTGEDWYKTSSYSAGKDIPDWFLDDALSTLKLHELSELVRQAGDIAMRPLYLYDHSGITMNTSGFSCPWDSGQVGWIYADRTMIEKEYGALTPDIMQKAEHLLECEVKNYDYYLTGQCYGFQLFEGDVETDSCWGFIGDLTDVKEDVKGYLPEECKDIVDSMEYRYEKLDIEDVLEEQAELEDEYDEEL